MWGRQAQEAQGPSPKVRVGVGAWGALGSSLCSPGLTSPAPTSLTWKVLLPQPRVDT